MNDPTETALVNAAQQGDREALEQLLHQNWPWLAGLVAGIVRRRCDLDDVLQDVCIKVISKIHTLRQRESFRAWLACIARRQALRSLNLGRRQGLSLDHEDMDEPPDTVSLPVDERLARNEEFERVAAALEQLPQKYKEVLLLQHSNNLSYKQIAETLELPMTTVQIRLVRARRKILDILNDETQRRTSDESPQRNTRTVDQ